MVFFRKFSALFLSLLFISNFSSNAAPFQSDALAQNRLIQSTSPDSMQTIETSVASLLSATIVEIILS